jgi:hypothetical protein
MGELDTDLSSLAMTKFDNPLQWRHLTVLPEALGIIAIAFNQRP